MKIGIDARYAFRPQRRGIGEYVANLLTQLALIKRTHEYHLYIDRRSEPAAIQLPSDRFHIHMVDADNPLFFEQLALPKAAARDGVDILHFTANYGANVSPCPTVYTIHDLIEFQRRDVGTWTIDWKHYLGRNIRRLTLGYQARTAAQIITPSESSKQDITRILRVASERIIVIPHGAPDISPSTDCVDLRNKIRARGYNVPEKYILTFGALDPRKNTQLTITAFNQIHAEYPDAQLWVIGIEDVDHYRQHEKPWIHMRGYVPRADAEDLLRGAVALVYSSRFEGFGLPLLEAMAAGTPLIASSAASIPEVVGDAGILFPPTDTAALADAMRSLLLEPRRRARLRQKGLQRIGAFSWHEVAKRHLAVYESKRGKER